MPSAVADLIPPIRSASRQLVREWGFMRPTLANTSLSPTAVHSLIEIGDHAVETLPDLCHILRVDKAEAKRATHELLTLNYISSEWEAGRGQVLHVTPTGQSTLACINTHATHQVETALQGLPPASAAKVNLGLQLYAEALQSFREAVVEPPLPGIRIVPGYLPGILGRMLELHMTEYFPTIQWGRSFEASLAVDMGELLQRLDRPRNEAWSAVQTTGAEQSIVGTIFVDGEVEGEPAVAHLRAFIVDGRVRGAGVGRRLMDAAMGFVRAQGFEEVRLWTLGSLLAAKRLYEDAGFEMVKETEEVKWEQRMVFRQYSWRRDGGVAVVVEDAPSVP